MKVRDIMQTRLQTIAPDLPVLDAITTMSEQHVSALPVLDTRGRIIGVISTTDVLEAEAEAEDAEARSTLFDGTTVRELMTTRPHTVSADEPIGAAAEKMLHLDVHRLFVEEQGRLVGVISQTDIVRTVAARQRLAEVKAAAAAAPRRNGRHPRGDKAGTR